MPPRKIRVLSDKQQQYALEALSCVGSAINSFLIAHPDLRDLSKRMDLSSIAQEAVCMASFTYKSDSSKIGTYFSRAIANALMKACVIQKKSEKNCKLTGYAVERQDKKYAARSTRVMQAMSLLPAEQQTLLKDRLFDNVTLSQLAAEQRCDWRTVQRKVLESIVMLRRAEQAIP